MTNPEQTILVLGATGHQGGAVTRQLLARGTFKVRALVRDRAKPAARELERAGAVLAKGDLNNQDSLTLAMQGVTGVFSVQGFDDGPEAEINQGKVVVAAAQTAGVRHLVYSSVGGAERKTGIPHFDSKLEIEKYLQASGLPYTILRPVFFFFNYESLRPLISKGILPQPLNPETKLQQLSEDDYGRMVATVFEKPAEFLGQAREVASVELTMPQVAATFSRVTGHEVEYQQVPMEAFEKQAGQEMATMYRWFETDGYKADLAQNAREFGAPSDPDNYLRDHGWANGEKP